MSNAFQQHLDGLVPHLEVADLAEAAACLPRDTRLVLTQPDAAWTAAELATFVGRPVFAVNGLSTPDGARVPGPDGPGWAPFAQVLRHHPGQEPPDVAALLPPARWLTAGHGLAETGPAVFRLGEVVVRVVEGPGCCCTPGTPPRPRCRTGARTRAARWSRSVSTPPVRIRPGTPRRRSARSGTRGAAWPRTSPTTRSRSAMSSNPAGRDDGRGCPAGGAVAGGTGRGAASAQPARRPLPARLRGGGDPAALGAAPPRPAARLAADPGRRAGRRGGGHRCGRQRAAAARPGARRRAGVHSGLPGARHLRGRAHRRAAGGGLGRRRDRTGARILPSRRPATAAGPAEGIRAAVDRGAGVVNLSATSACGGEELCAAIRYAAEHDVPAVAARGGVVEPELPRALLFAGVMLLLAGLGERLRRRPVLRRPPPV